MTRKIRQQSQGEYLVIKLDGGLNYLDKWSFLQPLWVAPIQGRVGCAVELRHHGALRRLEVGAVLRR